MKFRKKPVVIEAVRWTGENSDEVIAFMGGQIVQQSFVGSQLWIPTLEGTMAANYGDWIIRGIKGEFYPCKNDIFLMTYEPAG